VHRLRFLVPVDCTCFTIKSERMAVVFENNKEPVDRSNISVETACCLLIFDTPRTWGTGGPFGLMT